MKTALLRVAAAAVALLLTLPASAGPWDRWERTEAPDDPFLAARDALARGDLVAAAEHAEAARTAAASPDQQTLADLLARAATRPVARGRIGVLLPLSGRYGAAGRRLREALEFGWREGGAPGELVVEDTGGTAAGAVAAFERLVTLHGVVAVAGPLQTEEAEAVAALAKPLGVPMLALAQGLARPDGEWVFQGWVTLPQQVRALVAHVMADRTRTRFVVLAPDTDYGRAAADAFEAEVTARQGTIVLREHYAADATDFRDLARKVARRPRADAEPVVDYDAIFLPDAARRVALVAAGLAVEDIPVGTHRPGNAGPVPLLGLSAWNSVEIISGGGIYARRGLFTDVFVPDPGPGWTWKAEPAWKAFDAAFEAATGRSPSSSEALAADAGRVLATVVARAPDRRLAFRDALLGVAVTGSITGASRMDPRAGALAHRIRILSVDRDGFEPVDALD